MARGILTLPYALATMLILCLPFDSAKAQGGTRGEATIRIVSEDGPVIVLGDTARFSIRIDTKGERIFGSTAYLSIPDTIFTPAFPQDYQPFIPGNWIAIGPNQNSTFTDSGGQDINNIPGIQYNYSQLDLKRTVTGVGILAYFDLIPYAIPPNPTGSITLTFDNTSYNARETKYLKQVTGTVPYEDLKFSTYTGVTVQIGGVAISPAIPDTNLFPNTTWIIQLDDHFVSGVYAPDDPGVSWNVIQNSVPPGASVSLDGITRELTISSTAGTHGILDLTIEVYATGDPIGDFYDQQDLQVIIDYPPLVGPGVPVTLVFNEDDSAGVAASDLYSDADDTPAQMTLWIEPDGPIHVNYDTAVDTVYFSADTNWFGSQDVRLFVQDALGLSIDTLISIVVNPVNDTPIVYFDNVSELRDTVVVHRSTPDTVDLSLFVSDVDNLDLTWSITSNPDPVNLSAGLVPPANDRLALLAADTSPYKEVDLILTATDSLGAAGSDTLVVSIRSWPPEIGPLPSVKILAGTPDTLSLNELVDDNDTPDAAMTWSFTVVAFSDSTTPDLQVTWTWDQATQIVIFDTPAGYAATDLLLLTVTDDDNNTDTDTTKLAVFATLNPTIFPLDTIVVYRDTSTNVLDLDDYVLDPVYETEDLTWSFSGGDSLQAVLIGDTDHTLTLVTDPYFFGWDSLTLIATNPDFYADTAVLVVRVIPRVDLPPVWTPLMDEVEIVFPDVIDLYLLTEVCKDDFTPENQLIFTGYVNPDPAKPLTLNIDPVTSLASISVPDTATYDTWLVFSAEDNTGQMTYSDTIQVRVKDSYSPVWARIPTVRMEINTTGTVLLSDYLSDRDTPLGSLTVNVDNPFSLRLTANYDPVTMELSLQAKGVPVDAWLTLTATDPENNVSITLLHVVVFTLPDLVPPEGILTYFYNPAADRWIHFVLVGDSTTVRVKTTYIYNSREVVLPFALQDSLPGTLTWIAPYHFASPGVYLLSAELIDQVNNVSNLSLPLTVSLSKSTGDLFASPDQRLNISYPPMKIHEGKLLLVTENVITEDILQILGEIGNPPRSAAEADRIPPTIYSLDSNLPEPVLVNLTYTLSSANDPYYSFYRLESEAPVMIETYRDGRGHFEAVAPLGQDVIFARSRFPAREAPLPDESLFCYPNPFNSVIQIRFLIRRQDRGHLVIYNLLGQEVFTTRNTPLEPGVHTFSWPGIDQRGLLVSSGLYVIRLETDGGQLLTQKVTLLK